MINSSVSVFFPCYNDKGTIGKLIRRSLQLLKAHTRNYEVIVIDDSSTDGSRQLLQKLAHKYPQLRLIFHKRNQGYGGALRSGFKAATKDLIFYTDGDAQYDINEMPLLFPLLTPNIDVVNGIKIGRADAWYRVFVGNIYNFFVRNLFDIDLFDVDCDFRLIRRYRVKPLKLRSNSGAICVELIKKLQNQGCNFREVSVHHYPRVYGQSQFFNSRRIWHTGVELVQLWFELIVFKI